LTRSRVRFFTSALAAIFSFSAITCVARPSFAQDVADDARGAHGRIALTIVGSIDEAPQIADTIRELLTRLGVAIDEAPATIVLARVRIDLTSPAEAALEIEDGKSGEILERRVVRRDSSSAIVREELAHAVLSTIEARLLADQDHKSPPPPPPKIEPVPEAPIAIAKPVDADRGSESRRPPPLAIDVATLGGAGFFSSGTGPQVHVGGSAAIASRSGLHPSLGLSFQYGIPFDVSSSLVTSHASFESSRAIASLQALGNSWFALDLGGGGGIDVISVSPRSQQLPSENLATSTTRVDPILSAYATANFALAPGIVFALACGVDFDLASRRYVVDQGSSANDILVPWRVRPSLLAEFSFTAHGDARFAHHDSNESAAR
jgi:hypothetical protein